MACNTNKLRRKVNVIRLNITFSINIFFANTFGKAKDIWFQETISIWLQFCCRPPAFYIKMLCTVVSLVIPCNLKSNSMLCKFVIHIWTISRGNMFVAAFIMAEFVCQGEWWHYWSSDMIWIWMKSICEKSKGKRIIKEIYFFPE